MTDTTTNISETSEALERMLDEERRRERARSREAVEAIQNAVPQDVENRAWVQQGIEIMRGRVLAAIDGGPTDD